MQALRSAIKFGLANFSRNINAAIRGRGLNPLGHRAARVGPTTEVKPQTDPAKPIRFPGSPSKDQ
jgi:hypothetical protein